MAWSCADDTCLLPHDHAGKCVPYREIANPESVKRMEELEMILCAAPRAPKLPENEGPSA